MKTKIFGGLLMIAVLAITSAAKADAVAMHHHRHHKFEHRLKRDVRNGEISPEQARHFHMEAKRIHQEKRMAKANGTFTPAERMHIHNEKKMMSRSLRRDEHNDKVRG